MGGSRNQNTPLQDTRFTFTRDTSESLLMEKCSKFIASLSRGHSLFSTPSCVKKSLTTISLHDIWLAIAEH